MNTYPADLKLTDDLERDLMQHEINARSSHRLPDVSPQWIEAAITVAMIAIALASAYLILRLA